MDGIVGDKLLDSWGDFSIELSLNFLSRMRMLEFLLRLNLFTESEFECELKLFFMSIEGTMS